MANSRLYLRFGKTPLILGALLLSVSLAQAAPVSLGDSVLDQVTAGTDSTSGSGGAIIGNSSEATINQTGGVILEGEAQSGAKGLNLVNSAESTVANGVNIWEVNGAEPGVDNGQMEVEQSNIINQEQRRSASMPNYSRPEGDTLTVVDRTGSETHNINLDRDNTVMDIQALTSVSHNTTDSYVDTRISGTAGGADGVEAPSIDTNTGKGLAISGQLDAFIDGGELQIGLAVGGAITAFEDIPRDIAGERPAEIYGGMQVGQGGDEATRSDFTLYGRLILPEITIEINGAGCGVAMGSCGAKGVADLATSDTKDDSTMDKEVSSSVGDSQFTDNSTSTYRSPFELNNAQAEYIVVDDSSLTVNTTFNLTLSGSAQSNINGMNVVNASGSAVANGVNIARTSGISSGGALGLSQTNVISHSR